MLPALRYTTGRVLAACAVAVFVATGFEPAKANEPVATVEPSVLEEPVVGDAPNAVGGSKLRRKETLPESQIPWRLNGILMVPGRPPRAILRSHTEQRSLSVEVGAKVDVGDGESARVTEILSDRVLLDNKGVVERMSLRGARSGPARAGAATAKASQARPAAQPKSVQNRTIGATSASRLRRMKTFMEEDLVSAGVEEGGLKRIKVGGKRFLGMFAEVGLQVGDVILDVNGTQIHDGNKKVFDALLTPGAKQRRLTFLRQGDRHVVDVKILSFGGQQ